MVLAMVAYIIYRAVKATPPPVRKFSLLVLVLGLVVIEIHLRSKGALPGFAFAYDLGYPPVTIIPVDSLEENRIMICDSMGINKFNRANPLSSIQPLNSEGFHSPYEFTQAVIDTEHAHGKKVLFLIGDSWTYGLNADSGYSFAALLNRSQEYTVLNAGIPGMDMAQYKAIVREYIVHRKLSPDKVLVCISRNDLQNTVDRKLTPGVIIQYCTNAGGFDSYFPAQDTVVATAKGAYAFILKQYTVKGILGEGWWSAVIGKSVLASRLTGWLVSSSFIHRLLSGTLFTGLGKEKHFAGYANLTQEIKANCTGAGIPVVFILLPSKFDEGEAAAPQFEDVVSLNNNVVAPADYPTGVDDHPNNEGHRKLFVAIKQILDTVKSKN